MNEIIEFLIDIKELLNDIKTLLENQKIKTKKEKSEVVVAETKKTETVESVFYGYTESEELRKSLFGFAESRKTAKSTITVRAAKLLVKRLDELAKTENDKVAIVEQSTMNGWKSFYPLQLKSGVAKQTSFNSYQQREEDYDEIERKILEQRINNRRKGV